MEKTCNSVLSKAQIQCLINKKENGHMTNEEYCQVFDSLFHFKKSLLIVKKNWQTSSQNINFTGKSHLSAIQIFLQNVIHLRHSKGKSFTEN